MRSTKLYQMSQQRSVRKKEGNKNGDRENESEEPRGQRVIPDNCLAWSEVWTWVSPFHNPLKDLISLRLRTSYRFSKTKDENRFLYIQARERPEYVMLHWVYVINLKLCSLCSKLFMFLTWIWQWLLLRRERGKKRWGPKMPGAPCKTRVSSHLCSPRKW